MTVYPLDLRDERRPAGSTYAGHLADRTVHPPKVKQAVFSTQTIEPQFRLESWRALLGRTHDIDAAPDDFTGRLVSTDLKRMLVHEMDASPQAVARSSKRARRDGQGHVVLHLTTAPFAVTFDGSDVQVPAGAVTVNVVSRSFQRSRAAEKGSVVVSLSRDLVEEVLAEPEQFHGTIVSEGVGGLLAEHMRSLARAASHLPDAGAESLGRATLQMLAAALLPTRQHLADGRKPLQAAALLRCKRHIRRHLEMPDLGPDLLCKALGISRSALYRLFEPSGGVAAYVRHERLNAARRLLEDPGRTKRISEVATSTGFTDDAAFSRAYRAAFGMRPSDTAHAPRAAGPECPSDLISDWLRGAAASP